MAVRFGYKASAEQFGPAELLDLSARAEAHGFDTVAVSDHFQPWRHHGGHSPAVLPWLGLTGIYLVCAGLLLALLVWALRLARLYRPM